MNTALGNDVNTLVQNHLSFVHFILKKFYPPAGFDYDDLFQIGCMGLVKAARKFDPLLGYQFTTYAGDWVEGEIRKTIRMQSAVKRTGNVISMESVNDDENVSLMNLLATYDSVEEEVEASLLFNELIQKEPVITKLALQGYTQREIGRKLGISRSLVSKKMQSMKKAVVAMS